MNTTTNEIDLSDKALAETLAGLENAAASVERRLDAGVRSVILDQAEQKFRESVPDALRAMIREDAVAQHRANEERALDTEAAAILADALTAAPGLTAALDAAIAQARRLPSFADTVKPDAPTWHTAALLDVLAEDQAERWIATHSAADALSRYRQAKDDGRDRAFVRAVEAHDGPVGTLPEDAAQVRQIVAAWREAIEARQAARVPQRFVEAKATIEGLMPKLAQLRARISPSHHHIGRAIRVAGRR